VRQKRVLLFIYRYAIPKTVLPYLTSPKYVEHQKLDTPFQQKFPLKYQPP